MNEGQGDTALVSWILDWLRDFAGQRLDDQLPERNALALGDAFALTIHGVRQFDHGPHVYSLSVFEFWR